MDFFYAIINNEVLMAAAVSWLIAACLKVLIVFISSRKLDWERLLGTGGMPSTHTTPVVACATSAGLVLGFDSPIAAVAIILAIVVGYDAAGIRRHAGTQARAINNLIHDLSFGGLYKTKAPTDFFKRWKMEELETLLGHNPIEVWVGVAIGILTAIVFHQKYAHFFR